ncbi:SET domain-containing protein [Serendipita vermifera]|nr:SET domain-containing protein [Serendipita vermifera]
MSSNFRDLKAKRDARTKNTSNNPSAPVTGVGKASQPQQMHASLSNSPLEIKDTKYGRGLVAKADIKPGTQLLKVNPHVHTISSKLLDSCCSGCTSEVEVRRCTKCRKVAYCGQTCQKNDWKLHKEECSALTRWADASPNNATPADSIRTIGRLIWSKKIFGAQSTWWLEVQELQSNRDKLSMSTQESFAYFAQSLVRYLGVESPEAMEDIGIGGIKDLVDLMSKFTTNSFTLTTATLNPIGVAISPTPALINHSCRPNAVVVFPRSKSGEPPLLQVIAIRLIKSGEEVVAAYVDITVPKALRQESLQKTYSFTCQCEECTNKDTIDPRSSRFCPQCKEGIVTLPAQGKPSECPKCKAQVKYSSDLDDKIQVANEGLEKTESLQWTDPGQALRLTTNLISLLSPFVPPASHPLLSLMRLRQSLLISEMESDGNLVDETIRVSAQIVAALVELLPMGHPVRGVAIAELGKLLRVDEPSAKPEGDESFPPRGYQRLVLARDTLLRAKNELDVGFGMGGGMLGDGVRNLLDNTDRELAVYRKGVKGAQANLTQA